MFLPTTLQGYWHAVSYGNVKEGKAAFCEVLLAQGATVCSECGDPLVEDVEGWQECAACKNGQCTSCCGDCSCDTCGESTDDCSCEWCSSCDSNVESTCSGCGSCAYCCNCAYCYSCENKVDPGDWCGDCDNCYNCCSCGEGGEFGHSEPIWQTRDGFRPKKKAYGHWKEVWGFDPDTVDPVTVFCDYYVTEAIMALGYTDIPSGIYPSDNSILKAARLAEYASRAKEIQTSLLENEMVSLIQYMKMAIWGEGHFAQGLSGYDGWGAMGLEVEKKYGGEAYRELARLFREFTEGSGYGGDAWAVPCDILADYMDGKIPPHIMLDRVCTLQHNNKTSSFWDKVEWASKSPVGWRHNKIPTVIGPAQACRVPAWSILLAGCSKSVRSLWSAWWTARNNLRRTWHLEAQANPILPIQTVKTFSAQIVASHEEGKVWQKGVTVKIKKPADFKVGCGCNVCQPYAEYLAAS